MAIKKRAPSKYFAPLFTAGLVTIVLFYGFSAVYWGLATLADDEDKQHEMIKVFNSHNWFLWFIGLIFILLSFF